MARTPDCGSAVALSISRGDGSTFAHLSVRPKPASGEMALGYGKPQRGSVMAPYVNAVLLVRYAVSQLQSGVGDTRCSCRLHDGDVVLCSGRPGWGRTEC